jgi:hypothetical protein
MEKTTCYSPKLIIVVVVVVVVVLINYKLNLNSPLIMQAQSMQQRVFFFIYIAKRHLEEEGILVMHKILDIGLMLDFCIRICNFSSSEVYHDQSAQIYNDSGNMAQFAGLAKLMSSKSNVKIIERS